MAGLMNMARLINTKMPQHHQTLFDHGNIGKDISAEDDPLDQRHLKLTDNSTQNSDTIWRVAKPSFQPIPVPDWQLQSPEVTKSLEYTDLLIYPRPLLSLARQTPDKYVRRSATRPQKYPTYSGIHAPDCTTHPGINETFALPHTSTPQNNFLYIPDPSTGLG